MMLCFFVIGLTVDDGRLTTVCGLSSMVVIGRRCLRGEFLFWQTQLPVQKEARLLLLRESLRVRSIRRVCIPWHNPLVEVAPTAIAYASILS
jgi:hypothetical protein